MTLNAPLEQKKWLAPKLVVVSLEDAKNGPPGTPFDFVNGFYS